MSNVLGEKLLYADDIEDNGHTWTSLWKSGKANNYVMKIEEAIIYVMVKRNGGMTTDQIADAINRQGLHQRKDGQPVTSKQVYATICRFPEMFTKEAGRIMLMI